LHKNHVIPKKRTGGGDKDSRERNAAEKHPPSQTFEPKEQPGKVKQQTAKRQQKMEGEGGVDVVVEGGGGGVGSTYMEKRGAKERAPIARAIILMWSIICRYKKRERTKRGCTKKVDQKWKEFKEKRAFEGEGCKGT